MSPTKRPTIRKRSLDPDSVPASHVVATRTISRAYGRAVAGFTLVAVLLAAIIITITGSRATITVTPKLSEREVPFTINISSGQTSGTDSLPGRLLELATTTSETVTITKAAAAPDPNAMAIGEVTISNSSGVLQQLVATTRLLTTDGKLYRLQKNVTVPANDSVVATVQADQAGAQFAIGPSTFTIPGLNPTRQQQITASNTQPFTLAATTDDITEAQLADARSRALEVITGRLSPLLKASLFDNETLTEAAVTTTPLELKANVAVGDTAAAITFSGSVRVSATLFNDQELRRRAVALAGANADLNDVHYIVQRAATGSSAIASITGTVTVRTSELTLQPTDLTGRTKADAQVYLELLPGVASAEVKLRPRWFNRLPQGPTRITIKVLDSD
jgi:hypothetical protein